jgi:acetyl esterase/lipase
MIAGDRFTGAEMFADLIERFGAVVVSVEYRLAPEDAYPAQLDDCYAGLVWTDEHAEELDGRARGGTGRRPQQSGHPGRQRGRRV